MVVAKIYIVVRLMNLQRSLPVHYIGDPRTHATAAQLRPRACGYQPYDTIPGTHHLWTSPLADTFLGTYPM